MRHLRPEPRPRALAQLALLFCGGLWSSGVVAAQGAAQATAQVIPQVIPQAIPQAIAQAIAQGDIWVDVELPTGFHLDLATGEVTSRVDGDGTDSLSYDQGRLVGPGLRAWMETGAERIATRVVRGGGVPASDPKVLAGGEFLFDHDAERWGYLRVRAYDDDAVQLEFALHSGGGDVLEREPREVRALAARGRVELSWFPVVPEDSAPADAASEEYVVTRRVLGADAQVRSEELARVHDSSWTDETLAPGLVAEYRVARVRDGVQAGFGARVRAVEVERPADWPIDLVVGARLNLLTGASGGADAHVEFPYLQPPSVTVRPIGGARILAVPKSGGRAGWQIPDTHSGRYLEQLRSVPVQGALAVALPSGIYARLLFEHEPGGGVRVRRQLDLYGDRVFPLPPSAPEVTGSSEFVLRFEELAPDAPEPDTVAIVVERELGYQRDDWEELVIGGRGAREVRLDLARGLVERPPLARFRFRHRYPYGLSSFPSDPVEVLLVATDDAQALDALLTQAMGDLSHPEYERRLLARGILGAVGEDAWPRLREALSSGSPELETAAREILLAADSSTGSHLEFVLRAQAQADGVSGSPSAGLHDVDPNRRAWDIVRPTVATGAAHGADSGAEYDSAGWAGIVSRVDPDEATGRFAGLFVAEAPGRHAAGTPFVLTRPEERRRPLPQAWRFEVAERDPYDLARAVRAAVDPGLPHAALVYLQVATYLESIAREAGGAWPHEDAVATVELVLRLVERFEAGGDATLLAAAEELAADPAARLAAMRELTHLRLDSDTARAGGTVRERIDSEGGDLEQLENLVSSLSAEGRTYVDVVLAPGEWTFGDDATDRWLDLRLQGLRLIGDGARIIGGVRVQQATDVVLQGLAVHNTLGAAVMTLEGSVALVDCDLAGVQGTVTATNGDVELSGTHISNALPERPAAWSLRVSGRGIVLARECLIEDGTIMPADEGFLYLDRCVVDGGARTVIQGQRSAHVVLRDVLVRGTGAGLFNVSRGLMHGVVMQVARDPIGRNAGDLMACPTTVFVLGGNSIDSDHSLERCALGEER